MPKLYRPAVAGVVLFSGFLSWGVAGSPAPDGTAVNGAGTTSAEVAAQYATKYRRITKEAVFVNPELAMLCRGASQQEVEAARVAHGPHANTAIIIYMDDLAAGAFAKKMVTYPVGSVVVKHKQIDGARDDNGKWVSHANDTGVGGMIKRSAGYDPEHGDWEYFYFETAAKIESGRIASCVQCHAAAKASDYVFGSWQQHAKD